jgi:DNA polymerase III gamma/tau subunit
MLTSDFSPMKGKKVDVAHSTNQFNNMIGSQALNTEGSTIDINQT